LNYSPVTTKLAVRLPFSSSALFRAHLFLFVVSKAFLDLLPTFLPSEASPRPQHPFAVLSAYLSISLRLPSTLSLSQDSPATLAATYLAASSSWESSAFHLPTADDFLRVCWKVVYAASASSSEQRRNLFLAALAGRSLETKRAALEELDSILEAGEGSENVSSDVSSALLRVVLDAREAGDVRVSAADLLRSSSLSGAAKGKFEQLSEVYTSTPIVPLREAVLPVLAASVETDEEREKALKLVEEASTADQVRLHFFLSSTCLMLTLCSSLAVRRSSRSGRSRPRLPLPNLHLPHLPPSLSTILLLPRDSSHASGRRRYGPFVRT
jgi:hypothetical protein